MPTCKECHQKWTWKQTLKKTSFTLGDGFSCPYCGTKQYISAKSRKQHTFIVPIAIGIPFLFNILFNAPLTITFPIALIVGLALILSGPYFIQLSSEDEPLF